jgi:cytochrome c biogenesis factor
MWEFTLLPIVCTLFLAAAIISTFKLNLAKYVHLGGIAALTGIILLIVFLFLTDDFDYLVVFANSRTDLAIYYKIGAFFTTIEGLLLGIIWVMNVAWALEDRLLMARSDRPFFRAKVLTMVTLFSILVLILVMYINPWEGTSDIFLVHSVDGRGLRTPFQSPWMFVQPHLFMLSIGLSGLLFCISISPILSTDIEGVPDELLKINAMGALGFHLACMAAWGAWASMEWGRGWGFDPYEWFLVIMLMFLTAAVHGTVSRGKGLMKRSFYITTLGPFIMFFLASYIIWSGKWETVIDRDLESKWFGSPLDSTWLLLTLAFLLLVGSAIPMVLHLFSEDGVGWETYMKKERGMRESMGQVTPFVTMGLGLLSYILVAAEFDSLMNVMKVIIAVYLVVGGIMFAKYNGIRLDKDRPLIVIHLGLALAIFLFALSIVLSGIDALHSILFAVALALGAAVGVLGLLMVVKEVKEELAENGKATGSSNGES